MKNLITKYGFNLLVVCVFFYASSVFSQPSPLTPNHTFNYQGQLTDNGSPANGNYDITVAAFFGETGGLFQGQVSEHLNTPVTNGLFSLNRVDLVDAMGTNPFDGFTLYLEVAVKPVGGGSYTAMEPRQLMQAVPYANSITNKGAFNGQVLTYNSATGQWLPETPVISPWVISGSDVSFNDGNVGIGTSSPAVGKLHIAYGASEHGLRITDNAGTTRLWVNNNGGTAIGLGNPPPALGLLVEGDSKQSGTSNGMLKYMIKATCTSVTQAIDHSFNGTSGSGSVTVSAFDISSGACRLTFPSGAGNLTDLNTRYWVATAIGASNRIVTCQRNAARELDCRRTISSSGSAAGGQFMVLVY